MYRQNTPAGEPEDAVPKHCHREGAIKGAVATQNTHHPLTLCLSLWRLYVPLRIYEPFTTVPINWTVLRMEFLIMQIQVYLYRQQWRKTVFCQMGKIKIFFSFFNSHPKICYWFKERGREREISVDGPPHTPQQGLNPQSRYVPWLGIKPATFWCVGLCSNQPSHRPRWRSGF